MKQGAFRVALYARVSTEAQEQEGQSLGTQIEMMRGVSVRLGAEVTQEYAVQESAMPGSERPSLTQLLKDASDGRFDAVIVCKMDRLSRSVEVLKHVERQLRAFGIQLFEGFQEHDLRSAEGRLNRSMQAIIAEYSVERLKWSACASRLDRAKRGWPHSGMLPFARVVEPVKDRKNADAVWALDREKEALAHKMYSLYINDGLTLVQVGKAVKKNPETVRRILTEQGGNIWPRVFVDASTGEKVEVKTVIPPLFDDTQIALIRERAKQNQMERANWTTRQRDYPLSSYLRCANPACGWSNLSGHQSIDKGPMKRGADGPKLRPYYLHLARNRASCGCVVSVPANELETEIFSRLGQFLADSDQLHEAIRAALEAKPTERNTLKAELKTLMAQEKNEQKVLANALDVIFEHKGTAAAEIAALRVDAQNTVIRKIKERCAELRELLKVVDVPFDAADRFTKLCRTVVGLNGHIPMFWPTTAKRALLALFFGGSKSTRFDRKGTNSRSDQRGIFLRKVTPDIGQPYFVYEAKGSIVDFSGAVTRVVEIYEAESHQGDANRLSSEQLSNLSSLAAMVEGSIRFRTSPDASRRWSA